MSRQHEEAHSLTHGHCNETMQSQLENETDFKGKINGDPFAMLEKTKLKMCDPSKVKHPCIASFEQPERPLDAKQEDEEHMKSNKPKTMSN